MFCRVRPFLPDEAKKDKTEAIESAFQMALTARVIDDTSLQIHILQNTVDSGKGQRRSDKIYEFDHVFSPSSSQLQVFDEVKGLVTSVLDGYSACIFAYGQTGSGKTYTMEGGAGETEGVIPRTLRQLTDEMAARPQTAFTTHIRMIEIYNEKIFDLLGNNLPVEARLDAEGRVLLPQARSQPVQDFEEMMALLATGNASRRVAATSSNEHSSRSHMLFVITVQGETRDSNQTSEGRLVLVDLAGSERVSKTESTGQRLVEGQHINKSLSSLGDVIHALNNKHKHVPFRNSTLTFVLQDVLAEGNKVLMVAQLSPALDSVQESLQTLEFANRVNKVQLGKGAENKTHAMIAKMGDAVRGVEREAEGGAGGGEERVGGAEGEVDALRLQRAAGREAQPDLPDAAQREERAGGDRQSPSRIAGRPEGEAGAGGRGGGGQGTAPAGASE